MSNLHPRKPVLLTAAIISYMKRAKRAARGKRTLAAKRPAADPRHRPALESK